MMRSLRSLTARHEFKTAVIGAVVGAIAAPAIILSQPPKSIKYVEKKTENICLARINAGFPPDVKFSSLHELETISAEKLKTDLLAKSKKCLADEFARQSYFHRSPDFKHRLALVMSLASAVTGAIGFAKIGQVMQAHRKLRHLRNLQKNL